MVGNHVREEGRLGQAPAWLPWTDGRESEHRLGCLVGAEQQGSGTLPHSTQPRGLIGVIAICSGAMENVTHDPQSAFPVLPGQHQHQSPTHWLGCRSSIPSRTPFSCSRAAVYRTGFALLAPRASSLLSSLIDLREFLPKAAQSNCGQDNRGRHSWSRNDRAQGGTAAHTWPPPFTLHPEGRCSWKAAESWAGDSQR